MVQHRLNVPQTRVRVLNQAPVNGASGEYVVYWMIAFRRTGWNFALQRAAWYAQSLGRPLLVFEPLRVGYQWASDRHHAFVLQGMADNAAALKKHDVCYYPYVEPEHDADKGLLAALLDKACVLITDDFPAFFLPRMLAAVAKRCPVRMEAIDSNGLWPMRATDRIFTVAHSFRRHLHKNILEHLPHTPLADPLDGLKLPTMALPEPIAQCWPQASAELLQAAPEALATLPIDHSVRPVPHIPGGQQAAQERWRRFFEQRLSKYATDRNDPDADISSGLSPHLHFGHIATHQIFAELVAHHDWSPQDVNPKKVGKREGWWGMPQHTESFLDELITWREIGFNMCALADEHDTYQSLPEWARKTLADHADDDRPHTYTLEQLDGAQTGDEIWNAAQRQLVREGRIHNYLRMLWGKKILEWSPSPQEALKRLIELNNKYALDGRDPNSYSGIFWCLGRYDRAWGPERPIFGKIRFMSSDSTRRKLKLNNYLKRFGR